MKQSYQKLKAIKFIVITNKIIVIMSNKNVVLIITFQLYFFLNNIQFTKLSIKKVPINIRGKLIK